MFRLRERRWMDTALRDDPLSAQSLRNMDRTDGLLSTAIDPKKTVQENKNSPICFGEELQFWHERILQAVSSIEFL